jgi:hypothetical protein
MAHPHNRFISEDRRPNLFPREYIAGKKGSNHLQEGQRVVLFSAEPHFSFMGIVHSVDAILHC